MQLKEGDRVVLLKDNHYIDNYELKHPMGLKGTFIKETSFGHPVILWDGEPSPSVAHYTWIEKESIYEARTN